MIVKELITVLLDMDMNKKVSIEYPVDKRQIGNYCSYREADNITVTQCGYGVILGVEDEN